MAFVLVKQEGRDVLLIGHPSKAQAGIETDAVKVLDRSSYLGGRLVSQWPDGITFVLEPDAQVVL